MNPVCIYSRMDSARLPGKALESLGGRPLLGLVIDRLRNDFAGRIAVLTGKGSCNEPIRHLAERLGIPVVSADDGDLVSRTLAALDQLGGDFFFRVNADTPFVDSALLKLGERKITHASMVTNIFPRTFPYGISVEVVRTETYRAYAHMAMPEEREHVTKHLYRVLKPGEILNIPNTIESGHAGQRYVVDTEQDLNAIRSLCIGADPLTFRPRDYDFSN